MWDILPKLDVWRSNKTMIKRKTWLHCASRGNKWYWFWSTTDVISKLLADAASSIKVEKHNVTVSNIVTRADQFKEKSKEVNVYLSKICMGRNSYLTGQSKTSKAQHLNERKLYLNRGGVPILPITVCKILSKVFNWCLEENNVKIAAVSSTAPQSDVECTAEAIQIATNEENIDKDLRILRVEYNKGTVMKIMQ